MSKTAEPFRRPQAAELARRLREPRRHIQVVAGARQVGKTTLVQQVTEDLTVPVRFASADEPTLRGADWIAQQWEAARLSGGHAGAILVLDEVQKAIGWSESVKRVWDETRGPSDRSRWCYSARHRSSSNKVSPRAWLAASRSFACRTGLWRRCRRHSTSALTNISILGATPAPHRWQVSLNAGGATSSTRWSRLRSPEMSCCSLVWTNRLCCDACSNWAVVTRDKCCPTPRCSVNFTTPAIRRHSRTISSCSAERGCSPDSPHSPAVLLGRRGRVRSSKS